MHWPEICLSKIRRCGEVPLDSQGGVSEGVGGGVGPGGGWGDGAGVGVHCHRHQAPVDGILIET